MYSPCQVLQALMGWAWLGWLVLTFLFLPTLWIVAAARNWGDNFFDTWNSDRSVNFQSSGGGGCPIADIGTDTGLPPGPGRVQPPSDGRHERSIQSRVEREVRAREQVWNFEKEAAKMRARLTSWIGHRRESQDARAAAQVDLEHGGLYIYSTQMAARKKQERNSVPPSPPLPPNGALRLNVEGAAHTAP